MPYVKPTVHLSRIAGTALKTFTHGSLQTVTASIAQNTELRQPLQDTLAGKFRKAEKARLSHVHQNVDSARQASTASPAQQQQQLHGSSKATDAGHLELGLDKYSDAWHKHHQRNGTKEWQQLQFARRIEWQPPSVVPEQTQDAAFAEDVQAAEEKLSAPTLMKRSYTTSAVDNFGKAFIDDDAAEAVALEQVNNAIAEEILRSKEEAAEEVRLRTSGTSAVSRESPSIVSYSGSLQSPITDVTPADSFSSTISNSDVYTHELVRLSEEKQYHDVPAVFQSMLLSGVQKPTQAAYRVLLSSAIEITTGKHSKVPRALEVYSDMLRRKVVPDVETFGILINLLANRASEAIAMRKGLEERLARYGGLEQAGEFMFGSSQTEHTMLLEDSSLSIALKVFDRAIAASSHLPSAACASLVVACADSGRLDDMERIYSHMNTGSMELQSNLYAPMIAAFGLKGDLKNAVETYDRYKELAIANNAGTNAIVRVDNDVYAAVIKAYGSSDKLKGGLKFLASIQSQTTDPKDLEALREVVALQALLPLALKDTTYNSAFDLAESLTATALEASLGVICISAADQNKLDISIRAFDMLSGKTSDLAEPAAAMLAMHIRNANVEAGEPFWRILETAPASMTFVEPTTMRAIALIGIGQATRGLRHSRRMFGRIRDAEGETKQADAIEQIDEAIELMGNFMLKGQASILPEAGLELLRMMVENGSMISPVAEHVVAHLGPEQISRLNTSDVEFLIQVQSSMILDEASADIAGPARFACLLETVISRSAMPAAQTETMIEKALVNLNRDDLSTMWNTYRYPSTPAFAPATFSPALSQPSPYFRGQPAFDDSFDPYASRTDVKGSNAINEMLERPQGRRLNEALTKFKNMRRIGRIPRMFTYGRLIEAAAKENNLGLAHDVLEMAKQDVPFDARYRVVRFGWQQILDHMVAGCLTIGRRDLAARYHQDLLDMGAAPSANTFGLYITTLKGTHDEASQAVSVFQRAKAGGVEATPFLYNALIGKLGKARRIDDCLFYFAEMRNLGIRPTSVTYGTIVNALCRVSDEKFAEEIFEEMESCANYKPRPAPYHSLMQFFLTTKRDRSKVIAYYERMRSKGIEPTVHTYKLLIDTHATLEPVNMPAAEAVLEEMKAARVEPEAVHYASLIHAKGCVVHDMGGARALFDSVVSGTASSASSSFAVQPCIYQALFESLNANHEVSAETIDALLTDMANNKIEMTPYIANALIHGWTLEKNLERAKEAFERVRRDKREPSTYEAMVRAYLAAEDREGAKSVVREALGRGYPSAVAAKISDLVR